MVIRGLCRDDQGLSITERFVGFCLHVCVCVCVSVYRVPMTFDMGTQYKPAMMELEAYIQRYAHRNIKPQNEGVGERRACFTYYLRGCVT